MRTPTAGGAWPLSFHPIEWTVDPHFDELLRRYAEAAVTAGLNLGQGQRLLIIGPRTTGGVSLEVAPLVRHLVESAYRAGAPLVEVWWGDESLSLARLAHAPVESFSLFSAWQAAALVDHVEAGHAVLSIYANDPDLFKDQPTDRIALMQQAASRALQPFSELVARNVTNWLVMCGSTARWAAKVYPELDPSAQTAALWSAIFRMCRLEGQGAAMAWHEHLEALASRADELNRRRYRALQYRGPGTDLVVGLPEGHLWVSGRSVSRRGVSFAPNMPTEEVFTMPHKDRVNGRVASSKPLSHGGVMIEHLQLRFVDGRVVEATASAGESVVRSMVASDEGAARLGEVALVPHSSPISQSGRLFYNTLFDENAASHLALGSAYRFTMRKSEGLDDEAFAAAGGNRSMIHVDFMIGSDALDVDGVLPNGSVEPLMRSGEWA
jgi:aminopeptidase